MDGSPEMEDFLHRSARKIGILCFGDDEEGLYLRCQLPVHQGQLELVFEIRKGSQPRMMTALFSLRVDQSLRNA